MDGRNPEEATDLLLKEGLNSGDRTKNITLNKAMAFGMYDNAEVEKQLQHIASDYIRIGLLTSFTDPNEVLKLVWRPLGE